MKAWHFLVSLCYNNFMVKNQKDQTQPSGKAVKAQQKSASAKSSTKSESKKVQPDAAPAQSNASVAQPAQAEPNTTSAKPKRKRRARGLHPMPALLRVPCVILLLMIVSIFLTWFMLWRTNPEGFCDAASTMEFIHAKPDIALYNYIVIFSLLALFAAVTWRPFFSTGLLFCLLSILAFINMQKYELRTEPLLPEEFLLADTTGNIAQFVDPDSIVRLVWGVIFVLVGSIAAEILARRIFGRDPKKLPWWDRIALIPRITYTMIALAVLAGVTTPILRRRDHDWIEGLNLVAWNQNENYMFNGFVVQFLYNMGNVTMAEPADYSVEKLAEIAEKYRAIQAEDNEDRVDWDEKVENIVVVLSETSYDPALLTKYYAHTGGDVTPNLHKIFRKYPSGYMYSPEYGGGTANVEFEVQTGLTNFWTRTFPYVNLISKMDSLPSIASWGKLYGFDTTAIHSYDGAMYKRKIVYPKIGYDEFIDANTMKYTDHEGDSSVINDRSIYRETLDVLKASDQPKVVGVVTMQNHAPYAQANYPEMEFKLYHRYEENWALEPSLQSLHEADKYLGEFIEALDELDERTVVLWFGDHAMGMLDQYKRSEDKAEQNLAQLTPYFVYANFDIESPYTIAETAKINKKYGFEFARNLYVNLPTTSPNCLQNTMYDVLGLKKPALFYLVAEVCAETPILTNGYFAGKAPEMTDALKDYELVNYDLLIGKKYWDGN